MIIMCADYVGYKVVEFLCNRQEFIGTLIIDQNNRGDFNKKIIKKVRDTNPNVEIFNEEDIKIKEVQEHIKEQKYDFGILAWWPYIITQDMINMTKRGFVNTHPGYLPYNRGKHPYFWSIVDETPFGVTLHYVDKDIDNGPAIARKMIDIDWEDTGETLYKKSRELILELFYDNYDGVKANTVELLPKLDTLGTFHYGKELEPKCLIDLGKKYEAKQLLNIIRGRMFNNKGESRFKFNNEEYSISIKIEKINN